MLKVTVRSLIVRERYRSALVKAWGARRGRSALVTTTFYGVRGSTPCPCESNRRYGGNTACVAVESPGRRPIVFDIGTGFRFWGQTLPQDGSFRGVALVTHLHWDHVQGLPFFVPINRPGAELDIYAPPPDDSCSVEAAFGEFMRPPYFPVRVEDLFGKIRFHDADESDLDFDGATVRIRRVPHVGNTNGYRVEIDGVVIAYISDHQQPMDGSDTIAESALELCHDADLLIHDAQFTPAEFDEKRHWGHCTVDYAVRVAEESGARRLALFHHDPAHGDDVVDELLDHASRVAKGTGVLEVLAASEGLAVALRPAAATQLR